MGSDPNTLKATHVPHPLMVPQVVLACILRMTSLKPQAV